MLGHAVSRPVSQVVELEVGHTSLDDSAAHALASITRLRRLHLRRVGFTTSAGFPLLTALQVRCPPRQLGRTRMPGRPRVTPPLHTRTAQSRACLPAVMLC